MTDSLVGGERRPLVPKRKYRMTRIGAGDWLMPSNDLREWWRLAIYHDGPSYGVEGMPRDREFWGAWKFAGPGRPDWEDIEDWERWGLWGSFFDKRQEAIDFALRQSEKSALEDDAEG